ncbi:uncharacterized protein LOC105209962 [Zeugodacus cucurbitae]|uniref:uncharacterized protein LOC105209962 n=1 Tax=Zeugodacus cucurbitae TaxID=28588 RepID=UPI0023D90558|nr:uncharacterized protein LOC105209962 [Zeugodacus cucurbitae]
MRRAYSYEFIAENEATQRHSLRSLNDVRRFSVSSSIVSARSTKLEEHILCLHNILKLKLLAVDMAIRKLINRIMFLEDIERSKLGKFIHLQCPEQILSWRYEDWLATVSNRLLWFKVLDRQMPPTQFTIWMKLKHFTAMRNCLYDLADSYVYRNGYPTPKEIMASIVKFHNFERELSTQAQTNKTVKGKVRTQLLAMDFIKRTVGSLTKKPEDLSVLYNIENSYVRRYHKVREEQAEMYIHNAEERLLNEIRRYKKRYDNEQFASTCTTDTYFNQIAHLRDRIAKLTLRYDTEYSRLDSNVNYLRTAIEKIETTRAYLVEQIEWFKEDVRLSTVGIMPPKRRSSIKPLTKNLQFHKERKLTLVRAQRSLMSISSQTKRSLRPRTRPKKQPSLLTGTTDLTENFDENLAVNQEENLREGLEENVAENLGENLKENIA